MCHLDLITKYKSYQYLADFRYIEHAGYIRLEWMQRVTFYGENGNHYVINS